MTPTNKRRGHLSLPEQDVHHIDAQAKAEGLSRNAYINKVIQWGIEEYPERCEDKDIQAKG